MKKSLINIIAFYILAVAAISLSAYVFHTTFLLILPVAAIYCTIVNFKDFSFQGEKINLNLKDLVLLFLCFILVSCIGDMIFTAIIGVLPDFINRDDPFVQDDMFGYVFYSSYTVVAMICIASWYYILKTLLFHKNKQVGMEAEI